MSRIDLDDLYSFLITNYGEIEAMRTLEAVEAVIAHRDNLDRLSLKPAQRWSLAVERLAQQDKAA